MTGCRTSTDQINETAASRRQARARVTRSDPDRPARADAKSEPESATQIPIDRREPTASPNQSRPLRSRSTGAGNRPGGRRSASRSASMDDSTITDSTANSRKKPGAIAKTGERRGQGRNRSARRLEYQVGEQGRDPRRQITRTNRRSHDHCRGRDRGPSAVEHGACFATRGTRGGGFLARRSPTASRASRHSARIRVTKPSRAATTPATATGSRDRINRNPAARAPLHRRATTGVTRTRTRSQLQVQIAARERTAAFAGHRHSTAEGEQTADPALDRASDRSRSNTEPRPLNEPAPEIAKPQRWPIPAQQTRKPDTPGQRKEPRSGTDIEKTRKGAARDARTKQP